VSATRSCGFLHAGAVLLMLVSPARSSLRQRVADTNDICLTPRAMVTIGATYALRAGPVLDRADGPNCSPLDSESLSTDGRRRKLGACGGHG
jgi:hypothetical protein